MRLEDLSRICGNVTLDYIDVAYYIFYVSMFESILYDSSEPTAGEDKVAAFTAGPREDWALARSTYFATGVNKVSLHTIDKVSKISPPPLSHMSFLVLQQETHCPHFVCQHKAFG